MWTERFQAKGLVPLWTPLRLKMRQTKTPDCVAVGITATQSGVSRSVSRVLCRGAGAPRDGHSSGTPVAGRLVQPTRAAARRPAWARGPRRPYSVLLPVGFAVPLPLPGATRHRISMEPGLSSPANRSGRPTDWPIHMWAAAPADQAATFSGAVPRPWRSRRPLWTGAGPWRSRPQPGGRGAGGPRRLLGR